MSHPFLKGFPVKYHKTLFDNAVLIEIPEGDFIFKDGQRAEHFFLIIKGKVSLLAKEQDVRIDPEANMGVLQTLKSGDVVGWSWIIPPYRWRFDAKAAENTKLLALNGIKIREKMSKDHSFAYEIYKRLMPVVNERLIATRLKLQTFGGLPFVTAEGG